MTNADYTYPDTQLLIDGTWQPAADGATLPVVDPADEEQIGTVSKASVADLDAALASAQRGFEVWRDTPALKRAQIMRKAAELMRERRDRIAWILSREQGKPLAEATLEVANASAVIDWFAEEAPRVYGRVIPSRAPNVLQMAIKLPVGPVAAFTPWNFPINQVVRKVSAALATGCSIIVKPSEETPASPVELIRAFIDAGVPPGVINVVFGVPAEISEYLIPHPVIAKISFTGSTAVGKHLAALAGQHMKRATMELGGHSPAIVFDDADLDQAVKLLAASKYRNAGQVCISPTRFLVQDKAYDRFVGAFTKAAEAIKVGKGLDEDTNMGPLANERRVPFIEEMITDAVDHGGEVATGGRRVGNKGYFFEPTVLTDVPTDARIMNEEPFGPVAIVNRFSTLDDAITEANRLRYGLASYAFTGSAETSHTLGQRIDAGMTTINHIGLALPEVPFGGVKDSGYGLEGGAEGVDPYLITKFVTQTGT